MHENDGGDCDGRNIPVADKDMMVTEYDGSSLAKVFTPDSNNYRETSKTLVLIFIEH